MQVQTRAHAQFEQLVRQANRLNLRSADYRKYIANGMRQHGWSISEATVMSTAQSLGFEIYAGQIIV